MAGVNLSHSMASQEEKVTTHPFSVSGFPLSIALLVLTLLGWGGLHWYIHTIDKKIATLDGAIAVNGNRLQSDQIDRVADFDARMALLGVDPAERVEPGDNLTRLESLIVPQVILTKYEYNEQEKSGMISGETDNFRYLAEQIISLKSDNLFSHVIVDKIDRSDEGKVQFSLKVNF